uniref:Uncharacterized protein n=1 Tax=Candidatus Kentrum sp. LPFa TaxID=2126335 RepID=A0A450WWC2_9GAMM|nr:MAG: hypothetical protein BECKLPF1236B_GA0070989_12525 [Candidatus Kentron sp. LPFa]
MIKEFRLLSFGRSEKSCAFSEHLQSRKSLADWISRGRRVDRYAGTFFICWGDETLNMIVSPLSGEFSTKRSKNSRKCLLKKICGSISNVNHHNLLKYE